jgi:LuxR family maltose regulon positive regulatory protein
VERALALAEPEGYARVFVDEGPAMAGLLTRMKPSRDGGTPGMDAHIREVLAAFETQAPARTARNPPGEAQAESAAPRSRGPIEPLSQRELEVLRLIGQGLSNREIGERLFLALDTIKGHNSRIFDKLDAKRRTEALARARELGLL